MYHTKDLKFAQSLLPFAINRISINDSIGPTKDDLIAVAVKVRLNKKEAEVIHSEIEETVKKFRK